MAVLYCALVSGMVLSYLLTQALSIDECGNSLRCFDRVYSECNETATAQHGVVTINGKPFVDTLACANHPCCMCSFDPCKARIICGQPIFLTADDGTSLLSSQQFSAVIVLLASLTVQHVNMLWWL